MKPSAKDNESQVKAAEKWLDDFRSLWRRRPWVASGFLAVILCGPVFGAIAYLWGSRSKSEVVAAQSELKETKRRLEDAVIMENRARSDLNITQSRLAEYAARLGIDTNNTPMAVLVERVLNKLIVLESKVNSVVSPAVPEFKLAVRGVESPARIELTNDFFFTINSTGSTGDSNRNGILLWPVRTNQPTIGLRFEVINTSQVPGDDLIVRLLIPKSIEFAVHPEWSPMDLNLTDDPFLTARCNAVSYNFQPTLLPGNGEVLPPVYLHPTNTRIYMPFYLSLRGRHTPVTCVTFGMAFSADTNLPLVTCLDVHPLSSNLYWSTFPK